MPLAPDHEPPTEATLSNWRSQPHSRWAFRNVSRLMPVGEIENDPDDVRPLTEAPVTFDDFTLRLEGVTLGFAQFLDATATDALVVLRDGRLAYEYCGNGTTAAAPHIIMSATKSVVGLIAGILQRAGRLDSDAEIAAYVPEVASTAYRGATIRHLLDMRTGVVLDEAALRAYEAATNWSPVAPEQYTAGLHRFFETLDVPYAPHGGAFHYISANTDLLGWAIERAAGESFAALAGRLLWRPLGAEQPAYITHDRHGAPRTTGGLCVAARDLARLGELVRLDGRRGDNAIVPADWLEDIAGHGDHDAWKHGEFAQVFAGRKMRYRSGWYVIDDAPKMLFAMGIHGQNLFVDRGNRLVIAKLSSQNDPIDYKAVALTHRAVPELRRCLNAAAT